MTRFVLQARDGKKEPWQDVREFEDQTEALAEYKKYLTENIKVRWTKYRLTVI